MLAKRVLVIEDERDILEMYEYLFEDAGYEVRTSLTGEHIFKQIKEFQPDLILLDIRLGDLNGSEICREIKTTQQMSHIRIILVSGETNIRGMMCSSGADHFMSKPFDINILLTRVEQLLAA
jgi:DNA-binding response OmpR family regulator